jgi:5-methylcytosine-specific restriction endonuclease McrA
MSRINRRIRRRGTVPYSRRCQRLTTRQLKQIYFKGDEIATYAHCIYCGKYSYYHIDHKIAIALGGSNSRRNLVIACRTCNLSKGYKKVCKWLRRLQNSMKRNDKILYNKIIEHNLNKRTTLARSIRRIRDSLPRRRRC